MGLVKAQCEGQQNSLESLTKKHEVLTKILEEQKKNPTVATDPNLQMAPPAAPDVQLL